MNCKNCGILLTSGDKFCKNCGAPVQTNEQTYNEPVQPISQPTQPVYNNVPVQPVQTPPIMNNYSQPVQQPSNNQPFDNMPSNKSNPIGIILIVLLVIGVLVGGYFGVKYLLTNTSNLFLFGKKTNENEETIDGENEETIDVLVGDYTFKVPKKYEELIEMSDGNDSISIGDEDNFSIYMSIVDKANLNNEEDRSAAEMLISFSLIMADDIELEEENELFGKDMIKVSANTYVEDEDIYMDTISAFSTFNSDNSILIIINTIDNVDDLFDETIGMIEHLFEE